MSNRLHNLKQSVSEGHYVVDDGLVAEAVMDRIQLHRAVSACAVFPSDPTPPRVRSFRRASHARSFRLTRTRTRQSRLVQFV
jgi:hypothetical protein